MRKISAIILALGLWTTLGTQTMAMCIWFAPPGRTFEPARDIKTLVVQNDSQQTLVVQPQFQGTATDFGLVMPFPSQPELDEAPASIFKELEDLTNPIIEFDDVPIATLNADGAIPESRQVQVVEQRDVGEYTATTLTASDTDALTQWLNDNGYEITDEKLATLDYYVEQGSAYFVTLKINISKAEVDKNGLLKGELNPLQFSFNAEAVSLPLRLMADTSGQLFNLVVYTLGSQQLYVPGAEIQFARKVTARDLDNTPTLGRYDPRGLWLTRNAVTLDTAKIEKDLTFYVTPADVVVESGDQSVRVNPELLDPRTGLIESETGLIRYVEEADENDLQPSALEDDRTRPLIVITVLLGISNIVLINTILKQRASQHAEDKTSTEK